MNHDEFIEKARALVEQYTLDHQDKSDAGERKNFSVYVVWSVKVLQNSKALLSTTLFDGMYYEVTLDGDKDQIYFDAYKKFENQVVPV